MKRTLDLPILLGERQIRTYHLRPGLSLANPAARGRERVPSNLPLAFVASLLGAFLVNGNLHADNYEIDPVHSSVVFAVKHSNLNFVYGLFPDVSGHFSVDGSGTFDISVGVESINSGNEGRDRHLKSPDFFSARQFPRIEFRSKGIQRVDDETLEVKGEIRLRGTSRPVTARITTATGSGRGGQARGGIHTKLSIKRGDFRLGGPGGLSDEVTVLVSLQGIKK